MGLGLLFERFLSSQRDGPPDIDIDIESTAARRPSSTYDRYGRHHTAQVANVITYRARSSVRDIAKAFGFAPGQQDAWSKQVDVRVEATTAQLKPDGTPDHDIPAAVLQFAAEVEDFPPPRHPLRRHGDLRSPRSRSVPSSGRAMDRRSVLQWDKDDCAATGLVKFDLLGLGMLSALHYAVDLIREHRGYEVDLATIRRRTMSRDAVPRRHGRGVPDRIPGPDGDAALVAAATFYDLVVEVALIRPGPIQGGSVHPTSVVAMARSRSPTCIRCSRTPSPRRSGCRCSRSS